MSTLQTQPTAPRRLVTLLYPGFELLDVYGPLEMFGMVKPEIELVTVAANAGAVVSFQGPRSLADHGFDDCPRADLLLVPGGIGTVAAMGDAAILGFLRRQAEGAERVMSVCSGSALLARAGLLDGLHATSNKVYFALAESQGEHVIWVSEARWVEDGRFATSSGVSAGIDMALAVIAGMFGEPRAQLIADLAEYTWHRDAAHDPFVRFLNTGDSAALLALADAPG
jgi:transcriptional regulator GlxA family with amidase domain